MRIVFTIFILSFLCLMLTGLEQGLASDRDDIESASGVARIKLDPNFRPGSLGAERALLYDNGPLINSPGTGVGGADESVLQSTSLGMNTLGFGHQFSSGNRMADDFTVTEGAWQIDSLVFYCYQTNSPTTSTITAVYYQIWDGRPDNPASNVVFGDLTTNQMIHTEWPNLYRVSETTTGTGTTRPIMKNTVSCGVTLPAGTYWIDWMSDGSLSSGPWAPPVTITGFDSTGNGWQYSSGAWHEALDSGTSTQQGLPFLIYGTPTVPKLLISEFVVTPTAGEFVEIFNPGTAPVALSDYYLTDATFAGDGSYYYNIVTGTLAGGGGFGDFHARFPDGATIQAGEYQTIAMNGADFITQYGVQPTYELFETDPTIPDMREALPGLINNQGGLTNGDEVIILYYWDGMTDLVGDVDYVIYDDAGAPPDESVDKTGVKRDGPDADTDSTEYLPDTAIPSQIPAVSPTAGFSTHRIDYTEGTQTSSGGNGVSGADETSENLDMTFSDNSLPSPNGPYVPVGADVVVAAQISGDSQYRTFWVNGSWDATGFYDPNWSGPMLELNDNGTGADSVAGDHIFTGTVYLAVDPANTYSWWCGSEDDANSFLDDGVGFDVLASGMVYTDTLIVDGDGGINDWVIALPGDFNSWNNANDMTRNGTEWSITMQLNAGTYEYKYAVMHQWNAAYGSGGIGGAGSNYSFTAPENGEYIFTFDDADNSQSVTQTGTFSFFDNFEAYTAGTQLVVQNPVDWTTWSGTPGTGEDPIVSDAFAFSGSNSVLIVQNNDLVKTFGSLTSGTWKISFQVYIPNGQAGYFNTLSGFTPNPFEWAMECYFDVGGNGRLLAGSSTAVTFSYTYDSWQLVEIYIDLYSDWAQFYFNGSMVQEWQWTLGASGGGSALQIDGNDFFGATANDQMYFDDYRIEEYIAPEFFDNFEAYTAGTQLVLQNPVDWTTWSGGGGTGEDPMVSDAFAYSGSNSMYVSGTNDCVKPIANYTQGKYSITFQIYIPTGADGYFNTLQDFAGASSSWGMQVYFGNLTAGAGLVDAGGAGAGSFTFNYDTWIHNEVFVDLDSDFAEYFVDGVSVVTWQWSTGPFGTNTLNQLGGSNFYAWTGGVNVNPSFYVDDYALTRLDTQFTAIGDLDPEIPSEYALYQNYPNPFNPTTTIQYDLKRAGDVSIKIYNMLGQEVRTLVNTRQEAGHQRVIWDGLNNAKARVASGIYIYRIQAGDFVQARKMILMK